MQRLLALNIWMSLPKETRNKLVPLFGIPRSGETVVRYMDTTGTVMSDGYTAGDMSAITVERMQEMLDTDIDDFYWLFEELVNHIDDAIAGTYEFKEEVMVEEPTPVEPIDETAEDFKLTWMEYKQKHKGKKLGLAGMKAGYRAMHPVKVRPPKGEITYTPYCWEMKMRWQEFTNLNKQKSYNMTELRDFYRKYEEEYAQKRINS